MDVDWRLARRADEDSDEAEAEDYTVSEYSELIEEPETEISRIFDRDHAEHLYLRGWIRHRVSYEEKVCG